MGACTAASAGNWWHSRAAVSTGSLRASGEGGGGADGGGRAGDPRTAALIDGDLGLWDDVVTRSTTTTRYVLSGHAINLEQKGIYE